MIPAGDGPASSTDDGTTTSAPFERPPLSPYEGNDCMATPSYFRVTAVLEDLPSPSASLARGPSPLSPSGAASPLRISSNGSQQGAAPRPGSARPASAIAPRQAPQVPHSRAGIPQQQQLQGSSAAPRATSPTMSRPGRDVERRRRATDTASPGSARSSPPRDPYTSSSQHSAASGSHHRLVDGDWEEEEDAGGPLLLSKALAEELSPPTSRPASSAGAVGDQARRLNTTRPAGLAPASRPASSGGASGDQAPGLTTATATALLSGSGPTSPRLLSSRPSSARPTSARPTNARPTSARPVSTRPSSAFLQPALSQLGPSSPSGGRPAGSAPPQASPLGPSRPSTPVQQAPSTLAQRTSPPSAPSPAPAPPRPLSSTGLAPPLVASGTGPRRTAPMSPYAQASPYAAVARQRRPQAQQQHSQQPARRWTAEDAASCASDEEDPAQVLQDSLTVLGEVEGLIRQALCLTADQALDVSDPQALALIPPSLLAALEDTINVVMGARAELNISTGHSPQGRRPGPSTVPSSAASSRRSTADGSLGRSASATWGAKPALARAGSAASSQGDPSSRAVKKMTWGRRDWLEGKERQASAAEQRRTQQLASMQRDLQFIQELRSRQYDQQQKHEQTLQEAEESIEALRIRQQEATVQHKWLNYQELAVEQAKRAAAELPCTQ